MTFLTQADNDWECAKRRDILKASLQLQLTVVLGSISTEKQREVAEQTKKHSESADLQLQHVHACIHFSVYAFSFWQVCLFPSLSVSMVDE